LEPGRDDEHRAGPLFWISAAMGWAVIAWGLRGIFQHSLDTRPANLARFVVGGALLHDLIIAPLIIGAGVLLARAVPGRARAVIQGALAVSGIVALFSYPLVRGFGLAANNPTSPAQLCGRPSCRARSRLGGGGGDRRRPSAHRLTARNEPYACLHAHHHQSA